MSDGEQNHSAGWYLASVATFMIPAGIQMVLLPYLLAIELQLFPDSVKEVEIFLLDRNIHFATSEGRRFAGDRARAVAVLALEWEGIPLRLSVFDPRDERLALKTSQAGRVIERAGLAEVGALVRPSHDTGPA